jgi:Anthranilate/para-aminobenzoate synthases component I
MLNVNLEKFKSLHKKKINQILYYSIKSKGDKEIENLIDNFLLDKNSFIFESVEKGIIKGRYTIFGKNPDKIWEFNENKCFFIKNNLKKQIKGIPKDYIEKIIEDFNFKIPKSLPPISSLISGYFSYDIIRYIEKIPRSTSDDLKIPGYTFIKTKNINCS